MRADGPKSSGNVRQSFDYKYPTGRTSLAAVQFCVDEIQYAMGSADFRSRSYRSLLDHNRAIQLGVLGWTVSE